MSNKSTRTQGIQFPWGVLERIAAHAEEAYPQECFGFLLGHFGENRIRTARPGQNVNTSRPHDRYEMDPQEFLRVQMEAERRGGEVVGFYHSHPDDRAIPSTTDREQAWEEYLYLIVPVAGGQAGRARLWQVEAPEGPFSERVLCIVKGKQAKDIEREDSCPS